MPELSGLHCNTCHVLDPSGNPGTAAPGSFGAAGFSSFDFRPQRFKIPHLRRLYRKVGMFGNAVDPGVIARDNDFQGDQRRGFGFQHDGAVDGVSLSPGDPVLRPDRERVPTPDVTCRSPGLILAM
jgi:hypothetical protein